MLNDGIVNRLSELLCSSKAEQASEVIAEMAKAEENRITFIQQEVLFLVFRSILIYDHSRPIAYCGVMCGGVILHHFSELLAGIQKFNYNNIIQI